jgi:hypothetical protein
MEYFELKVGVEVKAQLEKSVVVTGRRSQIIMQHMVARAPIM